jgi:hypothetical protein
MQNAGFANPRFGSRVTFVLAINLLPPRNLISQMLRLT